MTSSVTKIVCGSLQIFVLSVTVLSRVCLATPSVQDYDAVPPLLAQSAKPMIMLALSKDHQLFYKAFTDYDDLDKDGVVDTTYKNSFEYAGYFDSYKCYVYDNTNKLFTPVSINTDKYCNGFSSASQNIQWSGNFLNWATMTRIDEVRKVLYGGLRSTDSNTATVLERSYLPNDAHSFAKYYDGVDLDKLTPFAQTANTCGTEPSDVNSAAFSTYSTCMKARGITLCNTTRYAGTLLSQAVSAATNPPLARVVRCNYSLWAANERMQCLFSGESSAGGDNGNDPKLTKIFAASSNPSTSAMAAQMNGVTIGDYPVRAKVCVSAELKGQEDCKSYPGGNLKPVGILQEFGDDDSASFGLMTGTYKKNKSGGVLRKNIGTMTNEVNTTTDGTFKAAPATGGIINTINQFRMVNYNFNGGSEGTYNSSDNCTWGANSFSDGSCTNWGNPFSELMLECYRYFAGKQPNSAFDGDDTSYFSGLTRQTTWSNPQTNDTACANLNVIAFNASTVSYDSDTLSGVTDLNTTSTAQQLTKLVGDGEAITNKYFFVGENGGAGASDNNQICTAKLISDLGLVKGTCPDSPRLSGSFRLAGMAYQAHTTDLRSDITDNQNVTTYGVTLSPALPKVTVANPSNGKTISILPACRNSSVGGNCAIVDFKIVSQTFTATEARGTFYVNWEDSEQGGDFDQDMSGIVSYVLTTTSLTVTTDVFYQSTGYAMGFGFVVSGTSNDGFHVLSGINGFTANECSNCNSSDAAKSTTYTLGATSVSGSTVGLLEQPLYYAAKWGGFHDGNSNSKPDVVTEWDRKNNTTGLTGADGIPDNYFQATNPKELKNQLTSILVNILERTAAGTSAALVSNTGAGEGALFQALYNPRVSDANGATSVSWVGSLNAMFIDKYGNMREDNAAPYGTLTSADNILDIYYDTYVRRTFAQRYAITAAGKRGAAVGDPVDILKIRPIWSARDALGAVADKATQRNYSDLASTKRYIFTGIDKDGDGNIAFGSTQTETADFVPATFPTDASDNTYRLLGLNSTTKSSAANIVNYIRGVEGIAGFRNRTLDINGDGTTEPWLLGDIVHSSPVSVGRPSASYEVTFGDDTYQTYRQTYEHRRQVVYVGSNDGMLHAFNAGFFNPATLTYALTGNNNEVAHPLGSELWAYVPYNLLPHLQWLTKPDYPHVYYVDSSVKSYDVNIFADDATHPGGWGTIIVVGMRLGGGEYTLDPNSDDDGNAADDITLRSAYVIMDVTDPENPPVLIGEITRPTMGYTTAEPTVLKLRIQNSSDGSYSSPDFNKWFLVLGSGPRGDTTTSRTDALNLAVSNQTSHLYFYDLAAKTLHTDLSTGESNSFVGGIAAADWNTDFVDDNFYYGTVAGTPSSPSGKLKRGTITLAKPSTISFSSSTLLDVNNQPFSSTPLTVRDLNNNDWIYAGTGRFFVVDDNNSTATQSYYGVKEPKSGEVLANTTVAKTSLINTTDIQVFANGNLRSATSLTSPVTLNNGASVSAFFDVVDEVSKTTGWYFNFTRSRARNTTAAVVSDQSLIFTEYQPSGLKCQPEGQGFLDAPHLLAGIPGYFAPIGTDASVQMNAKNLVLMSVSLGQGSPSTPQIHQNSTGVRSAIVQTSTGQITWQSVANGGVQGKRQSWREIPITW